MTRVDFEEAYARHRTQIAGHARSTFVPGMESEDVEAELMVCLWKACRGFSAASRTTFESYWWSLWLNRKTDLIRAHNAGKRVHPILTDDLPEVRIEERMFPLPPDLSDPLEVMVWVGIGEGLTPKDIRGMYRLSSRRYYTMVAKWKTDVVRRMLLD